LIDAAINGGRTSLPLLGSLTINQIALTLAVTISIQAAGSFNSALSFSHVGQSALADLRSATYGRLLALPMTFFGQRRVGELASRVSTDIAQIEGALIDSLPQACRQVVFLGGGLALIATTSLPLTAVMLGTLPLLIGTAVFFGRRLRRFSRETQDRLADSQTIVEETLQAIASVKSFANERFELERYSTANHATLAVALQAARWRAVFVAFFIAALFGVNDAAWNTQMYAALMSAAPKDGVHVFTIYQMLQQLGMVTGFCMPLIWPLESSSDLSKLAFSRCVFSCAVKLLDWVKRRPQPGTGQM
jgi:ABC-type multidrug transport system fused ATPase/permease subunit